jgi:hypothetical protein
MDILTSHHVYAGGPGLDRFHCEYDLYRFSDGTKVLVARSYTDEPHEVHFLRCEKRGDPDRPLIVDDLLDPLFRTAVSHLRELGMLEISWLNVRGWGYELVPA